MSYAAFLERKTHLISPFGVTPDALPSWLYPFQQALVTFALERGRAGIFADCGLGKTPMQLAWADAVVRHANKSVLILTPLAVGAQTVAEARKFGATAIRSRDGSLPAHANIVVSNYEQLHHFHPRDFAGLVCDESSILKHVDGATRKAVTRFMAHLPFRLLCTATAAPNDYIELGSSSEALGELSHSEMLTRFFSQSEVHPSRRTDVHNHFKRKKDQHFAKLAFRVSQTIDQWHLKPHAERPFWRWVASWARACRSPRDLGFDDDRFVLPPLIENDHIVTPRTLPAGYLFQKPAFGLQEEREERRRTLQERCEYVANLAAHDKPVVIWCHLNDEANLIEQLIPGAKQVRGGDTDDEKEATFTAFSDGSLRVLVTKPKIGAWGLNWQHCAHVITFATHSYEQYYQSVRRCWRFGQTQPVVVDIVSTEGEAGIRENMKFKADQASVMFDRLVEHMHDALTIHRPPAPTTRMELPAWL